MESTIQQSGNNVCMFVESALYQHMLDNDKKSLRNTMIIINRMPGIEDVNMYDANDNLVYTSFPGDSISESSSDCKSCHSNLNTMFPRDKKSLKVNVQ